MTVQMWVGVVLLGWCVASVVVGLVIGPILRKLHAATPPPVKPEHCLMCELEAVSRAN
jgi:hypothetical protein